MDRGTHLLKIAAISLVAVVVVMFFVGLFIIKPTIYSSPGYGYGMMYGGYYGYWYIMMPIMAALAIIFVFLFFYLIGSFKVEHETRSDPLDILKDKFARGEITEDEFKKKKDLIS
ncbi:MAG: SHOCT domain-containing protein [Candidatus Thermoplasmatota archaeon]|nr:SHOCT domain-containing protein [Candidatus Thermoplasmatota archaeon]